jgi:Putative auto-transporter adhesin, head GIN domain
MKLSTKLLLGLSGILLIMMLISAFSVKSEYQKINQKDPYWDFEKISKKSFKHLKVIGQKDATGKVNIIENKDFAVNVSKKWMEDVKVSFENDTLVVRFLLNPAKVRIDEYINYENIVTILCPDLSSIKGELTNIKIDSLNQDKLKIEANKITSIDIRKLNSQHLSVNLDKNSNCEFRTDILYKLEDLEANVASNAVLKMRQVYPNNFVLNASEKSVIEMNGTALKAIKK